MIKKYKLLNNFGVCEEHAPFLTGLGDRLTLEFDQDITLDLLCGDKKITAQTVGKRLTVPEELLTETLRLRGYKNGKKYLLESVAVQKIDLSILPEYVALSEENARLKAKLAELETKLKQKTEIII